MGIIFTPDHKEKLLSLCDQFFKQHKKIFVNDKTNYVYFGNAGMQSTVHWFELCINRLPREIFKDGISKFGQGHIDYHITKMLKYFEHTNDPKNFPHPVEYLYKIVENGKHLVK